MTPMLALIRGINVGGRARLSMADLRAAVERCGHASVRTYIQSGNVVFGSAIDDPRAVEAGLAAELAKANDVSPAVMVRTAEEWSALVAGNPFAARAASPGQLHVLVFACEPGERLDAVDADAFLPEEFAVAGAHAYLLLPGGIGRSKLAPTLARRAGVEATARNWRSVTRLCELLDELG
jgi:uncharacterized protein (DUF1697 family)